MGITSYLKGKAKEAAVNLKTEHDYSRAQKLENRDRYNKGYAEGQYKRGLAEGSGQIVPASRSNIPQAGRSGGSRTSQKPAGDLFGSFGGIGGGIGLGFGEERQHAAPPMRTTEYNPRTGKVRTMEPIQPQRPQNQDSDSFGVNTFWGTAESGSKKKGEKHPYDLF